ncbi:hypothetical protein [Prochlorothrix hollandica]
MHPVDPALTGDRGTETLLTFPLNSYPTVTLFWQSTRFGSQGTGARGVST